MRTFVLRRLVYMVFAVFAASAIVFGLARMSGDPRNMYLNVGYGGQEQWDAWGKEMGLDKPLVVQYFVWVGKAVRGDFGESLRTHFPAFDVIKQRIPATLQLGLAAYAFMLLTAIPLGVLSAVKRGSPFDLLGRTFALFGQALPPFWLGIMLILFFSVQLELLPTSQRGDWKHYILPAVTLGWLPTAGLLRLIRSSMLEVLDSEYIKFARAKGVGNWKVVWKHALRNAALVPLTYAALTLVGIINGAVVTETVFAWPGLGKLMVTAVNENDFPVLVGGVLIIALLYQAVVFLLDLSYGLMDPRIRLR